MGTHANAGKPPQGIPSLDGCGRPALRRSHCPLAHQLRNSLNVVIGHCDILAEKTVSEEVRKQLDAVCGAAWNMADILERCRTEKCEQQGPTVECAPLNSRRP